jgi:hypothetical protein
MRLGLPKQMCRDLLNNKFGNQSLINPVINVSSSKLHGP